MVEAVRLPDPARILGSYPHQLSGGQQQRVVIAMALMSQPALLILDEPTTALDVTVEAGIVDLVDGSGAEFGTSMLFISHNLGLVLETCDRICVMYSGEAVETGPIAEVFDAMRHPYTQGLFRSIPAARRRQDHAGRSSPIPATSPCPTSARRAATSGRAAATSRPGAATPPRSRCCGQPDPRQPLHPLRRDRLVRAAAPAKAGAVAAADRRRGAARRQPAASTTRSAPTRCSAATPAS